MECDDDEWLVQCLEQAEEGGVDPLLFTRPEGLPMVFENLDCDNKTKELIEAGGGVVVNRENDSYKINTIKIKFPGDDETNNYSEDIFDKQFIYDSFRRNRIANLVDYRLNKPVQFDEVEYDPLDVLLGYKSWNDVKLSMGG